MPRVLFYLPVVTPWWFENIVIHLIGELSTVAEVHVLVPPLWRNTGIGPAQLDACQSLRGVHWHIVNDDNHPSLRSCPADPDGLVEYVRSINPDYTFCRSADIVTPARFPGQVVYLLEAGAPPFPSSANWIILQRDFWHLGAMPVLDKQDAEAIAAGFAKPWKRMQNRLANKSQFRLSRSRALTELGIPHDRKVIALPLEYEHEETFTACHNRFETNLDLVHHVSGQIGDDFVLAITDHPLNCKHVDNSELYSIIDSLGPKVHRIANPDAHYYVTNLLIKNCDGLVVQNTKALYSGAFFGKPTLRLSDRPTADWIGAHHSMAKFLEDVASGRNRSLERARLWFGFHMMHEVIDPAATSGAEILDRVDRPFSRERLESGLARFQAYQSEAVPEI